MVYSSTIRLVLKTGTRVIILRFILRSIHAATHHFHAYRTWRNVLLEQIEKCSAFDLVLIGQVGIFLASTDGPAVVAIVSFAPPSIEDRQVQSAISHHLHATGTGCLQRTSGIIQPDIDTLDQMPTNVHVVVFEEDDTPTKLRSSSNLNHAGDQFLAALIFGMCLPGENELDWPLLVVQQSSYTLNIPEDQITSFVCCEPAGESNGQ